MKPIALMICVMLCAFTAFACNGAQQGQTELPNAQITPALEFAGMEVLELASDPPDVAGKTGQFGMGVALAEGSITFDAFVYQDVNMGDYVDPMAPVKTGETVTLSIDENSEFWLYDYNTGDWVRVSTADFAQYFQELGAQQTDYVMYFYAEAGTLLCAMEPNVP